MAEEPNVMQEAMKEAQQAQEEKKDIEERVSNEEYYVPQN